ncbi:hypothetical protein E2C01_025136 [Portunus trituberculatus]|uniref:Uncharacterized protein n=1 Tax=Portunus trituberculatus TaxID=210409 RepID=A0A5B7EF62_PORTR|nr:hypothetical protein [Portunus trituberculatus]
MFRVLDSFLYFLKSKFLRASEFSSCLRRVLYDCDYLVLSSHRADLTLLLPLNLTQGTVAAWRERAGFHLYFMTFLPRPASPAPAAAHPRRPPIHTQAHWRVNAG